MMRHWDLEFKLNWTTQHHDTNQGEKERGSRQRGEVKSDRRKESQRKTGEEKWWGRAAYADLETRPWTQQLAALLGTSFCFCLLLLFLVPDENVWMAFHHILKMEQKCTVLTHHEFYVESQGQGSSWKWWDCLSAGWDHVALQSNIRNIDSILGMGSIAVLGNSLHSGETAETNCVVKAPLLLSPAN